MEEEIDARGMCCPEPLIRTRKALERVAPGGLLRVLVDNQASKENVTRFAKGQGHQVTAREKGPDFELDIIKQSSDSTAPAEKRGELKVTAYINSEFIGRGSDELGAVLMTAFIKTIPEISPPISTVIFLNGGVRHTTTGSPVLDTLKGFECKGIEIYSCGTCLDYFGLMKDLKVGRISNMYDIMAVLAASDRVIKP